MKSKTQFQNDENITDVQGMSIIIELMEKKERNKMEEKENIEENQMRYKMIRKVLKQQKSKY